MRELNQGKPMEFAEVETLGSEKVSSVSETFFESQVSFTQAVKITGKNKGTISKDTNSGKLKFEVSETGQKLYKVSDLYTLYGLHNPQETKVSSHKKPVETVSETIDLEMEIAILRERLRSHETVLALKDEQIRDLQISRDKLLDQNNRLTLLLPAAPAAQSETLQPTSQSIPFWQRFFN